MINLFQYLSSVLFQFFLRSFLFVFIQFHLFIVYLSATLQGTSLRTRRINNHKFDKAMEYYTEKHRKLWYYIHASTLLDVYVHVEKTASSYIISSIWEEIEQKANHLWMRNEIRVHSISSHLRRIGCDMEHKLEPIPYSGMCRATGPQRSLTMNELFPWKLYA
jgi:hypothetical protein